jgi:tetratricopeptide (TPR) repeat protein
LDHIKQQNELSVKLLQMWAYFDNQDLWFELLQEGRTGGPEWLCQLTEDELAFNQAVRVLCDHGLIEVDKLSEGSGVESQGYGMHSCVHSWTVHVVNTEWASEMAGIALECVARHVPNDDAQNSWVTQRRLMRHLSRCWGFVIEGRLGDGGKDWILYNFACMCSNQGRFDEAEKMYQRALAGFEKAWGPKHTSTLTTVHNLGALYVDLGRLDEAEKMYQRALAGYEKAWGPEHTSTLGTVNNLGLLYADLGRLDEAEKMYQRALAGKEKAWGPKHASTLTTVHNLGLLYRDRCHIAQQQSTCLLTATNQEVDSCAGFLSDMVSIEDLYTKFPTSSLPGLLGRVFIWAGRDSDAIMALQRQMASYCDGCQATLSPTTDRFVCRSCNDCDLCRACHERYGEEVTMSSGSDCQDHTFILVPIPGNC